MIRHRQLSDANQGAVKMTAKSDDNIAALAALFPAAFSAELWRAHRPLKVGIGDELVARGVLGAREVNAALKQYIDRLKYQKCLAAGGARFDLEGNVAGEVSRQQRCRASRMVARIKARELTETEAAKGKGAVRQAAAPPSMRNSKVVVPAAARRDDAAHRSGRLGLADLKRAAQERWARQEAGCAGGPASQAGI
jgi:sRNA-binding protein